MPLGILKKRMGWALWMTAALSLCACRPARVIEPRPGSLADYANQARDEGKTATGFTMLFDENGSEGSLDDQLALYSALVVVPTSAPAVQTVEEFSIHTWHVFRVLRALSRRPVPTFPGCQLPRPQSVTLESEEIVIPLAGGTAVIDGVAVTMSTNGWREVVPEQRYVILGIICPGRVVILPMSGLEVFEVTPDGRILRDYPKGIPIRFQFEKDMLSLGTVDRLAAYIKEMQSKLP